MTTAKPKKDYEKNQDRSSMHGNGHLLLPRRSRGFGSPKPQAGADLLDQPDSGKPRRRAEGDPEIVRVAVDEIVYIIADGNYCDLMLANGYSHKMTFQLHYFEEYFETALSHNPFVRVGRSVLVNLKHIRVINIPARLIRFGGHTLRDDIPALRVNKLGRDSLLKLKNELNDYEERRENN